MAVRTAVAVTLCLLLSVLSLLGQTTAGLTGTVMDSSGAVVPGARISLVHSETGIRRDTVSNDAGFYQFPLLAPGDYSITVQMEGFKQLTHTYSSSIDNVPLQQGGGADGPMPQDIRFRFLDRGLSGFDIRHLFTQSLNYTLPIGAGKRFDLPRGWIDQAFGGWQMNLIVFAGTGLPFTPTFATSVSNARGSRPDRLKEGKVERPDLTRWFDTSFNTSDAAWATPRQFTYGNSGRNILRGPDRTNFDFSVFKEFSLTEHARLQFRAEFFNLFNHPQFDLPNASIGSPNAGRISSTVGTPRDIQFGLRLSF